MCHLSTELKKTKKCGDYWWKSKFKCQSKGFRYIKYQGTHCAKGSRKVSQLSINSNFYKFLFKYYLLIQVAHRDCSSRWNTISTDSTRHVQLYLMHSIVMVVIIFAFCSWCWFRCWFRPWECPLAATIQLRLLDSISCSCSSFRRKRWRVLSNVRPRLWATRALISVRRSRYSVCSLWRALFPSE